MTERREGVTAKAAYKCRFCTAKLTEKSSLQACGWDWITGTLPKTEHCCPVCLKANKAMWQEIARQSQQYEKGQK